MGRITKDDRCLIMGLRTENIQHNYSFIAQCYLLAIVATPIRTLLPDWVNPSFLIFDICSSGGGRIPRPATPLSMQIGRFRLTGYKPVSSFG